MVNYMGELVLDKFDRTIAISSGALAGALDALICDDISFEELYKNDVQLISKNGKIYYLPLENDSM